QDLSGVITPGSVTVLTGPTLTNLSFNVLWTVLTPAFQASIGTTTGVGSDFTVFFNKKSRTTPAGAIKSDTVSISSTPEVGTGLLMGTGLLTFGTWLRRRGRRQPKVG